MAPNRKLFRVGTPLPLEQLKKHLDAIEAPGAIVRHMKGELVVEAPDPELADE